MSYKQSFWIEYFVYSGPAIVASGDYTNTVIFPDASNTQLHAQHIRQFKEEILSNIQQDFRNQFPNRKPIPLDIVLTLIHPIQPTD